MRAAGRWSWVRLKVWREAFHASSALVRTRPWMRDWSSAKRVVCEMSMCQASAPARDLASRTPPTPPLNFGLRPLGGQGGGELAPGGDVQLAVRAREVDLYGLRRHVQQLRDVAVGLALRGEPGHAQLALRQGLHAVERRR